MLLFLSKGCVKLYAKKDAKHTKMSIWDLKKKAVILKITKRTIYLVHFRQLLELSHYKY